MVNAGGDEDEGDDDEDEGKGKGKDAAAKAAAEKKALVAKERARVEELLRSDAPKVRLDALFSPLLSQILTVLCVVVWIV